MGKFDAFFPGENVLMEQTGWYVKSLLNAKTGTIVLTDKRLAFVEEKVVLGGVLVKAADAALGVSKPKLKVDVEIGQIKTWSQPRKIDILVENTTGEKFKLRGVDYPKWDEQLKKLKG